MKVMGRRCGYLALVASIVSEADFVFIPEWPPEVNWPDKMCRKLEIERQAGQRLNIIIVSEGAIDRSGTPIRAEDVEKHVVEKLKGQALAADPPAWLYSGWVVDPAPSRPIPLMSEGVVFEPAVGAELHRHREIFAFFCLGR